MLDWLQRTFFLEMERREEVLDQLYGASSPGFDYFLLVVLSCTIATFGLITDSAAVIIGAMLVAPLMSPILGLSLASIAGERRMFQNAVLALVEGVLLAIILSSIVSWGVRELPFGLLEDLPGEVAARTRPTPIDLGIALAGGAAAAYALAQPRISAALPGVAIATALMPPLCTVGVGLSIGETSIAFGAFLLFLTNLTAISFAGIVVFAALGFRPLFLETPDEQNHVLRVPRSLLVAAVMVLIVTVPLVFFTLGFVRESRQNFEIRQVVAEELSVLEDAELVELDIGSQSETLSLRITVRTSRQPQHHLVVVLQRAIAGRLQRPVALQLIVVPATRLDPLVPPTPTNTATVTLTPTPGPSLTPTITRTPTSTITATPTETLTPTVTVTPTQTPTSTPTSTATPVLAYINGTGGRGVALRATPAGEIVGFLSEGTPVQILYRREMVERFEWIEIRDLVGREGWVLAMFLAIRP